MPQALMGLFGGTDMAEFSAECHSLDCSDDGKVLTKLQIAIRSKLFLGFTHVTNSLATVTIRHVGVPQA